jgi:hypothetical protein
MRHLRMSEVARMLSLVPLASAWSEDDEVDNQVAVLSAIAVAACAPDLGGEGIRSSRGRLP